MFSCKANIYPVGEHVHMVNYRMLCADQTGTLSKLCFHRQGILSSHELAVHSADVVDLSA